MIVTVPVFYKATVVLPGKRKPEDCILAADAHLRIDEAPELPLAVRCRPDIEAIVSRASRSERAPPPWLHGLSRRMGTDYLASPQGGLLTPLTAPELNLDGNGNRELTPQFPQPVDFAAFLSALHAAAASGHQLGMLDRDTNPFLSAAAMGEPETGEPRRQPSIHDRDDVLPVRRETEAFRSVVPVTPEARDMALAQASMAARSMLVSHDGLLLMPSTGPRVSWERSNWENEHRPRVEEGVRITNCHELDVMRGRMRDWEFLAYSAVEIEAAFDGVLARRNVVERVAGPIAVDVLIPDSVTWDSGRSCLAAFAANLASARQPGQDLISRNNNSAWAEGPCTRMNDLYGILRTVAPLLGSVEAPAEEPLRQVRSLLSAMRPEAAGMPLYFARDFDPRNLDAVLDRSGHVPAPIREFPLPAHGGHVP